MFVFYGLYVCLNTRCNALFILGKENRKECPLCGSIDIQSATEEEDEHEM